jgi:hypothetical protein
MAIAEGVWLGPKGDEVRHLWERGTQTFADAWLAAGLAILVAGVAFEIHAEVWAFLAVIPLSFGIGLFVVSALFRKLANEAYQDLNS